MFNKRIFRLILALAVFTAMFFVAPSQPVEAATCNWHGIDFVLIGNEQGDQYGIIGFDNVTATLKGLRSIRGFSTYRAVNGGMFVSQSGVVLADPEHVNRWEWRYTYVLYHDVTEKITISVATHPDTPDRAYWFYTPYYESGNFHPCIAIETSLRLADEVFTSLKGLRL